MKVEFNHYTGSYIVPDLGTEEYSRFMAHLGFHLTKKGWVLTFGRTVCGVESFAVWYTRYAKQCVLDGVPAYAVPSKKLSKESLNQALGRNHDILVWDDKLKVLKFQIKPDTARLWAFNNVNQYDAGEFRNAMFRAGIKASEGWYHFKPTRSFCRNIWPTLNLGQYIKIDDAAARIIEITANRHELMLSSFRAAKPYMAHLAEKGYHGFNKPFQHQAEWLKAVDTPSAILAFDMGLGKTLTSTYWALAYFLADEIDQVMVVCPKSVKATWLNVFSEVEELPVIVSTWASIPEPPTSRYVVILDESHYTQDPDSKRSAQALRLNEYSLGTLCLSGTPAKNGTARDLFVQAQIVGLATASSKAQYTSKYGWVKDMNLQRLNEDIQPFITHRTKGECLDLPEKTRVEVVVDVSEEYKQIYQTRYQEFMARYRARVADGIVSGEVENLVELSGLRLASALGKVEGVAQLATDILSQGKQVVIFFDFREAVDRLAPLLSDYKVAVLKASDSESERTSKIKAFQAGQYDVFLTTFKCGGVGLELTPCSYMILGDRPWTPGDAEQAEDRCHRIGQVGSLTVYWVYWDDPDGTEKAVDVTLQKKAKNIQKILK